MTEGTAVKIIVDGQRVEYTKITFSDGSSNVKVEPCSPHSRVVLELSPQADCDGAFWEILLVRDALVRMGGYPAQYVLRLPYLPHARADRVFEEGNALPLRVFTNLFHLFDKVHLCDPHSEAWREWVDEEAVHVEAQSLFFYFAVPIEKQKKVVLVAPDKGAVGKAKELQNELNSIGRNVGLICADKERDPTTGRIIKTKMDYRDLTGKHCIIVDDICDGGGTFLALADILCHMNAETVDLYVTHGIFSRGLEPFDGYLNNIYVHQVIADYVTKDDIDNFNKGEI